MHMRALLTPKHLLVALVLAGFCTSAWGGRVADLYAAEVPMPEGSGALAGAFEKALAEVLVKVTGRRYVATDESVMEKFADPSALVQQYRIDPDGKVWILFDRTALKRILDQAGQPVWGEERPTTLVWLIIDEGRGEREILASGPGDDAASSSRWNRLRRSQNTEDAIRGILQTTAVQRGIPIILPLVDSEEITSISISAVWGGFAESLLDASARYGAEVVLVGRARVPSLERVRVRWTLMLDGERYDWESDLAGGPNELADFLAARLATSIDASRRIFLQVFGVDNLSDYGRVSNYVGGLDVVEGFTVDRVAENQVIFSLHVRGDANRLKRSIALRRVLQIVEDRPEGNGDNRPTFNVVAESLHYQLVPER